MRERDAREAVDHLAEPYRHTLPTAVGCTEELFRRLLSRDGPPRDR